MNGQLFAGADMAEAVAVELGLGRALVYSARSPDKPTSNEDAAVVMPVDSGRALLAVADGLGGQRSGGAAAALALDALRTSLVKLGDDERPLRGAILDAIERANEEVLDLGVGAATTLAVAEIVDGMLRAYHVGDSVVLVVGQRGKLKLQTVAHSPVGYAVESGLMDEREALDHEERHLISNAIGSADMRIEIGSPLQLAARDTILLATDGLLDNLTGPEIVESIRVGPLELAARRLAELGRARMGEASPDHPSKPDDLTFVLFRLGR